MIALTSKIARLPFTLREQLNHRLQNGEAGQPLLDWLNQKPAVKKILAKLFNNQPINKQNLSDWRHGGYRDWVRHQSRQQTIQRLAEQGGQFHKPEGNLDLYDSFSQIVIAEMAEELEQLSEITDRNDRWKRLREISRELSRLQHGYNHSRSVELNWTKRNDQFVEITNEPVNPSQPQSSQGPVRDSRTETKNPVKPTASLSLAPIGGLEPLGKRLKESAESGGPLRAERAGASESLGRGEGAVSVHEKTALEIPQTTPPLQTVDRFIYHRRCGRGCVCPHCHPEDGQYPYTQAVQDDAAHENNYSPYWNRPPLRFWITHCDCDCYCDCEKTHPYPCPSIASVPAAVPPSII